MNSIERDKTIWHLWNDEGYTTKMLSIVFNMSQKKMREKIEQLKKE